MNTYKEPWVAVPFGDGWIRDKDEYIVIMVDGNEERNRIVACINFSTGVSDEELNNHGLFKSALAASEARLERFMGVFAKHCEGEAFSGRWSGRRGIPPAARS